VPEFIDPVFTKTSPKRSFSLNRKRAYWLVFAKTGSTISGTGNHQQRISLILGDLYLLSKSSSSSLWSESFCFITGGPEAVFLDVIGTKVLRVFLLAIHSHLLYKRMLLPLPLSKIGLKLVCNVNIVNLKSENSQDRLYPVTSSKLYVHEFGFRIRIWYSGTLQADTFEDLQYKLKAIWKDLIDKSWLENPQTTKQVSC
jgi:hypothetical protein